ncbi:TonB family protein [Archangium gephyra]|uniref:energy transducer TonB n=1 Tax=Archangium gephyra TaxID=48 RepID=UPI0035D4FFF7
MQRWERPEVASGSRVPASAGAPSHTLFGAVLQSRAEGSGRGRFVKATLLALVVHGAALLLLSVAASSRVGPSASPGGGGDSREVAVRFMVPRAPALSASAASPQLVSRPAPVRRQAPKPAQVLALRPPAAEQPVARKPLAEAVVEATEAAPADVATPASTEAAPAIEAVSGGSGVLGGTAGGSFGSAGGVMPPPPPSLTREQRQSLTSSYLQELFRSRIAARFHYPPEAEHLGLEGIVTLRVSIDRSGQLLGMRVQGPCPHAMLCDAALRTVRESVPFPPPPAELGASIAVDVPFQYRLE